MSVLQSAPQARLLVRPTAVDPEGGITLDVLYDLYGPSCYGLACSVLRDLDLAQDVVQEAFLEHWRSAAFDVERSTHRRWLLMLTHRKAVDRVRYEQRRKTAAAEFAPEQVSTWRGPDDLALANVVAPKVRAAMAALPRVQQEALSLAFWGGYTQREVAQLTGTPLGTVKTRIRRGMMTLRLALADEHE